MARMNLWAGTGITVALVIGIILADCCMHGNHKENKAESTEKPAAAIDANDVPDAGVPWTPAPPPEPEKCIWKAGVRKCYSFDTPIVHCEIRGRMKVCVEE